MAERMKPSEIKSLASSIIGRDDGPAPKPAPADADAAADASGKISEQQAGYLELADAKKDSDCTKVQVNGGVSSDKGCCNIFDPADGAQGFSCGNCEYLAGASDGGDDDEQEGM